MPFENEMNKNDVEKLQNIDYVMNFQVLFPWKLILILIPEKAKRKEF